MKHKPSLMPDLGQKSLQLIRDNFLRSVLSSAVPFSSVDGTFRLTNMESAAFFFFLMHGGILSLDIRSFLS